MRFSGCNLRKSTHDPLVGQSKPGIHLVPVTAGGPSGCQLQYHQALLVTDTESMVDGDVQDSSLVRQFVLQARGPCAGSRQKPI
jgi:hypothetical protein